MFLKLYFENQIHKISKIPATYKEFVEKVQSIFRSELKVPACTIQYEDEEGDKIMISAEDDYKTMLSTESTNKTVKIYISARRLSSSDISLKKSIPTRSHSDNAAAHSSYYSSDDDGKDLSDKEEEKTGGLSLRKSDRSSVGISPPKVSPKQVYHCGVTLKDTKSHGGDRFELPKNSFVMVTKYLDNKGLVELVHKGNCGLFLMKDLKIVDKAKYLPENTEVPTFASTCYRRPQYIY
jgi:hypothetical protein